MQKLFPKLMLNLETDLVSDLVLSLLPDLLPSLAPDMIFAEVLGLIPHLMPTDVLGLVSDSSLQIPILCIFLAIVQPIMEGPCGTCEALR